MNLPDLYARVCAVRPELAITDGSWCLTRFGDDSWDWTQNIGDNEVIWRCEEVTEKHAAALILARWEDCLPEGVNVMRERDGHRVWKHDRLKEWFAKERIEAIAAFYLEGMEGQSSA